MKLIMKNTIFYTFSIILIIALFASCKSDEKKPAQPSTENVETTVPSKKKSNKKPNRNTKLTSQKDNGYWSLLQKKIKVSKDQIQELKALQSESNSIKKKDGVTKAKFIAREKEILGDSKFKKKEIFDRNWRSPVSSLSLFNVLNIDREERKKINDLTKKYNKQYFNQGKSLDVAQKKALKAKLLTNKMSDIKRIISPEDYVALEKIISSADKRKIKGIYPFN